MNEELRNNTNLPPLPQGWVWVRLGEIAEIISGVSFKPEQLCKQDAENVRILRGGNIQNDDYFLLEDDYFVPKDIVSNDQLLRKYDIILVSSTGSKQAIGKAAIIKEELNNLSVGAFLRIIRIYENIQKKYIGFYFYTLSYRNYIREIVKGVNINNIKDSYLNEMFLPLPPLPEQRRIVAKIEELFTKLDAGVEALKKAKKQIKRYQQSVLKYAFEGKLTEEWRKANRHKLESASVLLERIKEEQKKKLGKKYRELSPVDQSELPELPEGWVWVRLGEISDIIMGQSPPSSTYNVNKTGLPFYQGKLDFGEIYPTPRVWCSKPQKTAESGDIFLSVRAPVGPTNICNEKCCIGRGLAVVRYFYRNENKFIFYFFRSIENQIPKIGTGSTFSAISKSQIENLLFPLSPLPEQHRIVEEIERRLSIADATEKIIDQCLKQAERLRQSILKTAFEGKLIPPACRQAGQDPNTLPEAKKGTYYVYVIECEDGSFYKGYTENLRERWEEHKKGIASEWTKIHKPKQVYYWEECWSLKEAIEREKYLKSGIGREWFKKEVVDKPENWEPAEKLRERIKAQKEKKSVNNKSSLTVKSKGAKKK